MLDYFEVVRINDSSSLPAELIGREGVILGRAQDSQGEWSYAVSVARDQGMCWQIESKGIDATGRRMLREDIYSG